MVGTIEPRKGHAQVLDAFDSLWRDGIDAALIIVGKQGWHMQSFVECLANHPEAGKRLLWLPEINDTQLASLYAEIGGLLMASEAEGFGLPLIEAAQHGTPIFARDLPIFREVVGPHAVYFTASNGAELAPALAAWLEQLSRREAPSSHAVKPLTWVESCEQLKDLIEGLNDPAIKTAAQHV